MDAVTDIAARLCRDPASAIGPRPIVPGSGPYLRTLVHCLGIWAVSADAGPLSRDLGCICRRWPIVPGSGLYLRTLAHCPGIWAVSADAGPLSRDLGCIWGRWPIVSGSGLYPRTLPIVPRSGPYLRTTGQRLRIWPGSAALPSERPQLAAFRVKRQGVAEEGLGAGWIAQDAQGLDRLGIGGG